MIAEALSPVASVALEGLSLTPKTLPPWLFYDDAGSKLFEQITLLPEYYLTRTERTLLELHASDILNAFDSPITVAELGAGTATKTGLLLAATVQRQAKVLYQPIDVSAGALQEAVSSLQAALPGVRVKPSVANYTVEPLRIERPAGCRILTLYIGSSIGNFSADEARSILLNLRSQLEPGDGLLLGTDLAPGANKSVETLVAAYDDATGVTAAFNQNVLVRLNRELGANFQVELFHHRAKWNRAASRIEMHLVSSRAQTVTLLGDTIHFAAGETIHTENSYKFTAATIESMLEPAGFRTERTYVDPQGLFALSLALAT